MFFPQGIDEISEDVYKGVDHSDSDDSEKSDSSDSEYLSDEEHKPKNSAQDEHDKADRKRPKANTDGEIKEGVTGKAGKAAPEPPLKDKQAAGVPDRGLQDKPTQPPADKPKAQEEGRAAAATAAAAEQDSDSERELVIDLGDEHGGRDSKRVRREPGATAAKAVKEPNPAKLEGEALHILGPFVPCGPLCDLEEIRPPKMSTQETEVHQASMKVLFQNKISTSSLPKSTLPTMQFKQKKFGQRSWYVMPVADVPHSSHALE